MKILQVNSLPVLAKNTFADNKNRKYYENNCTDTFVSSKAVTQQSFKANPKQIQAFLENPKAMSAIGLALSAFVAGMLEKAGMSENNIVNEQTADSADIGAEANSIDGFIVNFLRQNPADSQLKKENEKLKAENEKLKKDFEELKNQINDQIDEETNDKISSGDREETLTEEETDNSYKINFPKKHGRYSEEQLKLKEIAESLKLTETAGKNFEEVCLKLLQKGCCKVEGELIDNKFLTSEFLKGIQEKAEEADNTALEEFITDYNKKLEAVVLPSPESGETGSKGKEEQLQNESADKLSSIEQSEDNEDEEASLRGKIANAEFILTKAPRLHGLTIIDKIKLPPDPRRKVNVLTGEKITPASSETKDGVVKKPVKKTPSKPVSGFVNDQTEEFVYFMEGTAENYAYPNLKDLLRNFEKKYERLHADYYVLWAFHQKVGIVSQYDTSIAKEIKGRNNKNNGVNKYKHIKENMADQLIAIINSDPRFGTLFSLHGALRFIDRFIDFDSDEPYEVQAGETLDALERVIKRAVKNDKNPIKCYPYEESDAGNRSTIGVRCVIDSSNITGDEISRLGTANIKLGLCENQISGKYNKRKHEPLIHTIISE